MCIYESSSSFAPATAAHFPCSLTSLPVRDRLRTTRRRNRAQILAVCFLGELSMKTNYLAILVAAIAYWLLGGVWYAALFAKSWMALENLSEAQIKSANPVLPYIITFVLNLLIAYVLSQIILWRNATTAGRGAAVGVILWIGFIGPITYTTYMYEMRPTELFAINQFYPLAGMVLMGAIIGAWTKKSA